MVRRDCMTDETKVTLDWDIEYATVKDSVSWGVLRRFVKENETSISYLQMRASSHGNTHIRIFFTRSLNVLERYMVRAYLRDDVYRLKLDLVRDLVELKIFDTGNWKPGGASGTGRLWDWKISADEIATAGNWIDIDVSKM